MFVLLRITKIIIISTLLSSCSLELSSLKDSFKTKKAEPQAEVNKSYVIDYSIRRQKIQDRYADLSFYNDEKIKVAVMLPLSGKQEKLGQSLFKAMQLALFDHGDPRIELTLFDTKNNEYESITLAKQIIEADFDIIIGPVFAKNVKAIKPIISQSNLKLISFSNDVEIAGHNVYLIGSSVKEQVRRITEYAIDNNYEFLAALLPGNDYGSTIVNELRRTAYLKNATVLKSEFYNEITSLEKNIRNIAKIINEAPNADDGTPLFYDLSLPPSSDEEETDPNIVKRDISEYKVALLVPEARMLENVTQLMEKYKISSERVKLIGLSSWYDSDIATLPYAKDGWFTDIPHENFDLFGEYYNSYFYQSPARIATLAYDSLSVVASLSSLDENSTVFSNEMLTQDIGFNGISGIFRFLDTGTSERLLAVYGFQEGEVLKISPEPPFFINEGETDFTLKNN